MSFKATLMK